MTQIPIKRAVERAPGGMMVIPLLSGAALATLAPGQSGGTGVAGVAAASTAGNAVAVGARDA